MEITIRKAVKSDLAQAYRLICELALFEKAPDEVTLTLEQFEKDGFGENPLYFLEVAELVVPNGEKEIAGMALFFYSYSTWKGKILYLDDVIVTEKHRGKGIGKLLIDKVFKFAKEHEVKQVRWHVLDWNTPAINFYRQLGMSLEPEWITCKYSQSQIEQY
ncbi:MAG: GNAT family N-acetyltransferase [Sphingobacteriales bacterium]|nr:MAG: GNAT family N-acetyltransferase [Sphingobacteriales bacterium]